MNGVACRELAFATSKRNPRKFGGDRIQGGRMGAKPVPDLCYLCGKPLDEPISVDHVPMQQLFATEVRKEAQSFEPSYHSGA
jgi:hypothetical protein